MRMLFTRFRRLARRHPWLAGMLALLLVFTQGVAFGTSSAGSSAHVRAHAACHDIAAMAQASGHASVPTHGFPTGDAAKSGTCPCSQTSGCGCPQAVSAFPPFDPMPLASLLPSAVRPAWPALAMKSHASPPPLRPPIA